MIIWVNIIYIYENNSFVDNENETNYSSVEKEQDLSYSNSSQSKTFSDNLELLENYDNNELYKKVQETADSIIEHQKSINKFSQISKMILYYSSVQN